MLQELLEERKHQCYIVVVEHDLTVLGAVSSHVSCIYGNPGAYGVVTHKAGTR